MRILLSGGSGLIGSALIHDYIQSNATHEIWIHTRFPKSNAGMVRYISSASDIPEHTHFDTIINLNGAGIADARWTTRRKKILLDSRVLHTAQLVNDLRSRNIRTQLWINASAVGYYGNQEQNEVNESCIPADDFSHQLCKQWEETARKAEILSTRLCILRLGVVLSREGGFIKKMGLPFKFGLGTTLGSGSQFISWIHIDDVVAVINHIINDQHANGVFNTTAPQPVTNAEFSKTLARQLGRPLFLNAPSWCLNLALGEMSQLLLEGQRAIPERLLESGFQFKYSAIESALDSVLKK
jgi:uncharacterized protein (TIGR01777 family)